MNKIIIGFIISVCVFGLGFMAFAFDGMRAFSGKQPLFWWFYGTLEYVPHILILYLVCLGLKTLWNKE